MFLFFSFLYKIAHHATFKMTWVIIHRSFNEAGNKKITIH